MAYVRNSNTTDLPSDDGDLAGESLTGKQEAFARAWAQTGNQAAAYRKAYNVNPRMQANVVWASASRIAAIPGVRALYKQLQEQAALETVISIQEALQHQLDIATADPNEIVYVAKRCCRHCHGIDYKYQFIDDNELFQAQLEAIDKRQAPPTGEGGFGFSRGLDPVLTCPKCLGNGIDEVVLSDTRKLEGKARRLFKGLDYKAGQWVVLMHDQQKAWENVLRMLGAYNDKLNLTGKGSKTVKMPDNVDEQGAARAYLSMLG